MRKSAFWASASEETQKGANFDAFLKTLVENELVANSRKVRRGDVEQG